MAEPSSAHHHHDEEQQQQAVGAVEEGPGISPHHMDAMGSMHTAAGRLSCSQRCWFLWYRARCPRGLSVLLAISIALGVFTAFGMIIYHSVQSLQVGFRLDFETFLPATHHHHRQQLTTQQPPTHTTTRTDSGTGPSTRWGRSAPSRSSTRGWTASTSRSTTTSSPTSWTASRYVNQWCRVALRSPVSVRSMRFGWGLSVRSIDISTLRLKSTTHTQQPSTTHTHRA